jgi:general secretion pathway protein G
MTLFETMTRPPLLIRHRGFTLLEVLVVIVIIGLLAGIVAPRIIGHLSESKGTAARAQISAFEKALDSFRLEVGSYPTTEQGLAALVTRPDGIAKWNGPYLRKEIPLDPWGHPYQYKYPGERRDFDLLSLGHDGQPGGTGEAADITN